MHPPGMGRRGRTDSGGDSHSHEGERRTPDIPPPGVYDRDMRNWAERGMPYGPMPGRYHTFVERKKSIYTVIQMEIVCNDVFLNLRSSLLNDYLIEGNEQEITAEHK